MTNSRSRRSKVTVPVKGVQSDAIVEDGAFYFDTKGRSVDETSVVTPAVNEPANSVASAAWQDSDDVDAEIDISSVPRLRKLRLNEKEIVIQGTEYTKRLRSQFEKIHPRPKWAQVDSVDPCSDSDLKDDGEEYESIMQRPYDIIKKGSKSHLSLLSPDVISLRRLSNANQNGHSSCVVQTTEFHPTAPVLLTAGLDKTVRLFQIDGKENTKIESIYLKDLPISTAHFANNGSQVVASGRKPYFYVCDLQTARVERIDSIRGRSETSWEKFVVSPCGTYFAFLGQNGTIAILSGKTKQWISNLKMNGSVRTACFSPDGRYLHTAGDEHMMYVWDMQTFRCVKTFVDNGGNVMTSISISPNGTYLACGSNSGIVNLYDYKSVLSRGDDVVVQPWKSLMNLTTFVTASKFHCSSELFAFASDEKRNSFRLAHLPTGRIFSNWPTQKTPLAHIRSFDFSPTGEHLAMGNDKGTVLLYSFKHFQ